MNKPVKSAFANINWKSLVGLTGKQVAKELRRAAKYVEERANDNPRPGASYAMPWLCNSTPGVTWTQMGAAMCQLQFGETHTLIGCVDMHNFSYGGQLRATSTNATSYSEVASQLRMWAYQVEHAGKTAGEAKRLQKTNKGHQIAKELESASFAETYPKSMITEAQANTWDELIASLEKSKVAFDYETWIGIDDDIAASEKLPEDFCGTTACVAGHLALVPSAVKEGIKVTFKLDAFNRLDREGKWLPGWEFGGFRKNGDFVEPEVMAKNLLGLDKYTAAGLFMGSCLWAGPAIIANHCGLKASKDVAIDRCKRMKHYLLTQEVLP